MYVRETNTKNRHDMIKVVKYMYKFRVIVIIVIIIILYINFIYSYR